MKNYIIIILTLIIPLSLFGQSLSVSISSTPNEICNGVSCRYGGPTMIINEVMVNPTLYDASIKGCNTGLDYGTNYYCEGEWIELYNPHPCKPIDISCYFIGNSTMDKISQAISQSFSAGFIIPEGTIVPSQGFVVIRGPRAPAVPSHLLVINGGNTVEIVVDDDRTFIEGYRFWLQNSGGWIAVYDNNGIPQNAITWGDRGDANSNMNVNYFYPISIGNCGYTGELVYYNKILADKKDTVSTIGAVIGKTFRRIADGGKWDFDNPAEPTYGESNTSVQPEIPTCTGTATVSISGGVPPYQIFWDDGVGQTTETAVRLCQEVYCVTVTDANNTTVRECVSIQDIKPAISVSSSFSEYCEGSTIELSANVSQGVSPFTYLWKGPSGFTSTKQNPVIENAKMQNSGTYNVTVFDTNNCTNTEHIQINALTASALTIVGELSYCEGDAIVLSLAEISEIARVKWTKPNGEKVEENTLTIVDATQSNEGIYSVSGVSLNGCPARTDSINMKIYKNPIIDLGDERKICDEAIVLDAGNPSFAYMWNTSETTFRIAITEPGNYWVTTTDNNGCIGEGGIFVFSIKPELEITQEGDLCENETVLLRAITNAESILWNTGLVADFLTVEQQGSYQATVSIEGCETNKSVNIICTCNMLFPNAFIPNGRGLNTTFGPADTEDIYWVSSYQLYIYNRWGNLVFNTTSITDRWNGKVKGNDAPAGTYIYVVYFACESYPKFIEKHGTVLLIR